MGKGSSEHTGDLPTSPNKDAVKIDWIPVNMRSSDPVKKFARAFTTCQAKLVGLFHPIEGCISIPGYDKELLAARLSLGLSSVDLAGEETRYLVLRRTRVSPLQEQLEPVIASKPDLFPVVIPIAVALTTLVRPGPWIPNHRLQTVVEALVCLFAYLVLTSYLLKWALPNQPFANTCLRTVGNAICVVSCGLVPWIGVGLLSCPVPPEEPLAQWLLSIGCAVGCLSGLRLVFALTRELDRCTPGTTAEAATDPEAAASSFRWPFTSTPARPAEAVENQLQWVRAAIKMQGFVGVPARVPVPVVVGLLLTHVMLGDALYSIFATGHSPPAHALAEHWPGLVQTFTGADVNDMEHEQLGWEIHRLEKELEKSRKGQQDLMIKHDHMAQEVHMKVEMLEEQLMSARKARDGKVATITRGTPSNQKSGSSKIAAREAIRAAREADRNQREAERIQRMAGRRPPPGASRTSSASSSASRTSSAGASTSVSRGTARSTAVRPGTFGRSGHA